jgi:hypothetical protein
MTNKKFLKLAVSGVAVAAIAVGIGVGYGVHNKSKRNAATANYNNCRRFLVVPGIEDDVVADAPSIRRRLLARRLGVNDDWTGDEVESPVFEETSEIIDGWAGDGYAPAPTPPTPLIPPPAPTPPTPLIPPPVPTPPTPLTPPTPAAPTSALKGSKGTNGLKNTKGTKGTKGTLNGTKGTKGTKGTLNGTKGTKSTKSGLVSCRYRLSAFCSNSIALSCFSNPIPNKLLFTCTGLCCKKAR